MTDSDDHPLRYALVNELHARPSPRLTAPATVAYLAFKEPRDAANRDRAQDQRHLAALLARHGAPPPGDGISHHAGALGRHHLRWEGHTEFVTYAAMTAGLPERAFDPAAGAVFPADWQAQAPGKRIAAVLIQIDTLPDHLPDALARIDGWFVPDSLTVAWVLEEAALVAGDFRLDPAGWMRFAVFVRPGVGAGRVGRIVQRLLELETYRAMSMLGLGRARGLSGTLNTLDPALSAVTEGLTDDFRPDEALLHDLIDIAARLETAATAHAFRFGATAAYAALVAERVAALRESRVQGRQMLTEFMARRYQPAMRTVASAESRLAAMTARAARAGDLLRTRVDVARAAQNQALLESMDRRADLQLRLQHTVEGLSVVAISYYAVGLLSHVLTPLAARAGVDKALAIAVSTPLAVLAVWWGLRRIRAGVAGGH